MNDHALKLYQSSGSPNSRRVRIFLAEKGLEIPLIPVDLGKGEQHSEAYRAINPFVAGERYSIADITAMVTVDFAAKAINFAVPEEYSALKRWYAQVSKRPSAAA